MAVQKLSPQQRIARAQAQIEASKRSTRNFAILCVSMPVVGASLLMLGASHGVVCVVIVFMGLLTLGLNIRDILRAERV